MGVQFGADSERLFPERGIRMKLLILLCVLGAALVVEAVSEPKPEAEADPQYYYYRPYGYYGYYGKRSADAEPEAAPSPYRGRYGYGGYRGGRGRYGYYGKRSAEPEAAPQYYGYYTPYVGYYGYYG